MTAARGVMARAMSEDDLLEAVLESASAYGWLAFHPRPGRVRAEGRETYRTAMQGDPGFPDLVLAHPTAGVLFRELKSEKGALSLEQQVWLAALADGGLNVAVWKPADWISGLIDAELRAGARRR